MIRDLDYYLSVSKIVLWFISSVSCLALFAIFITEAFSLHQEGHHKESAFGTLGASTVALVGLYLAKE